MYENYAKIVLHFLVFIFAPAIIGETDGCGSFFCLIKSFVK